MELKHDDSDEFCFVEDPVGQPKLSRAPSAFTGAAATSVPQQPKRVPRPFSSFQKFPSPAEMLEIQNSTKPKPKVEEKKKTTLLSPTTPATNNQAVSFANAFGQPPAACLPLTVLGPLNVGKIVSPIIETGQIDDLVGDSIMTFTSGFIDLHGNTLLDAGDIVAGGALTCQSISFTATPESLLTLYRVISGTYTLSAGGPFTAGLFGSFVLTVIGRTQTLSIGSFGGTTGTLVPGQNIQAITFAPPIDAYIPPRDTIWPFMVLTSTSSTASGSIQVELVSPATLTIKDSDQTAAYQWTSATASQGWFESSISWTQ